MGTGRGTGWDAKQRRLERFDFNLKDGVSHNALKSLISGGDM
jgi:hypothetical protein